MPAAFAAAASSSICAPASVGRRKLITELYPIFFTSTRAAGVVAPAHATVVSTFEKFVMPGTVCFVTLVCAAAKVAQSRTAEVVMDARILSFLRFQPG